MNFINKGDREVIEVYSKSGYGKLCGMLEDKRLPFEVVQYGSGSRMKVVFVDYGDYIVKYFFIGTSAIMVKDDFGLRSELKDMVHERIKQGLVTKPKKKLRAEDITYGSYSDRLIGLKNGEMIERVGCIDINKAYYRAAYVLGYVNKYFYDKCLKLSKSNRLSLIGSLATNKQMHYINGDEYLYKSEQDDVLTDVWFHISNYVAESMVMAKDKLGDGFLFYWVDGIYFIDTPENVGIVDYCLKLFDFEYKKEKVDYIVAKRGIEGVPDSFVIRKDDKGNMVNKEYSYRTCDVTAVG